AGHLSLSKLKVMSAIETCRTAALGGHVEACSDCGRQRIAYNSCRNRHCPRCQGAAARAWLEAQEANLLPVGYFHVVFTLPAEIADIAFHNKGLVYDLLFKAASETMLRIAADPKHLGTRIGITAVLHTWGSAMTHHPHIHMIVPGGGISPDGRWISSRPAFLLPVRVLGALFRRLFLSRLLDLHDSGKLAFFGKLAELRDRRALGRYLAPARRKRWVVYAKAPFAGPEAVLAYLSRYTHRVAISNSRLLRFDGLEVSFRYKDYRRTGADRQRVMTLFADEFIRRFLIHVLPRGFHRIRHYGLLAGSARKDCLAQARDMLGVAPAPEEPPAAETSDQRPPCPCCGGTMVIIETFAAWCQPRAPPTGRPTNRETVHDPA
ncbi:MAG: family transposase, partial [Devosia sp.]|nr:family transposase [Devosia sp.]